MGLQGQLLGGGAETGAGQVENGHKEWRTWEQATLVLGCFLLSLKIMSLMAFPPSTKGVPRREPFSSLAWVLLAALVPAAQIVGSSYKADAARASLRGEVPRGSRRPQLQGGIN